jgi:hypothetical protein
VPAEGTPLPRYSASGIEPGELGLTLQDAKAVLK